MFLRHGLSCAPTRGDNSRGCAGFPRMRSFSSRLSRRSRMRTNALQQAVSLTPSGSAFAASRACRIASARCGWGDPAFSAGSISSSAIRRQFAWPRSHVFPIAAHHLRSLDHFESAALSTSCVRSTRASQRSIQARSSCARNESGRRKRMPARSRSLKNPDKPVVRTFIGTDRPDHPRRSTNASIRRAKAAGKTERISAGPASGTR